MNAVIYARYSSDNQREESIEGQVRECKEYAEKNGFTVLHCYIDRALTGKTDDRPSFQTMIKDSNKNLFDVILVWKLDRFARNRYDSARYKAHLKKNGVTVVSATETISKGSEGIILESVLEGYAEYYSAELSEKVIRGMTENVLKGKFNGGNIPIGYYLDEEHHLQIDEKSAPYVLESFELYDKGYTVKEITKRLKVRNIKNAKGNEIQYNSVDRMLKNRRYIGEEHFHSTVIPNAIPAIIPIELFERVQARREKNKNAPSRPKAKELYLISTKIYCGYCGGNIIGESGENHDRRIYRYYKCSTIKYRTGHCEKKSVRKAWLEDFIIEQTKNLISDNRNIDDIISLVEYQYSKESTDLPLYEAQLAETEKGIENIVNAIQQGIFTKSTKERLDELEKRKEELQIAIANEKMEKPRLDEKFLRLWLKKFRGMDLSEFEQRRIFIETIVNSVILYDDHMIIGYNCGDIVASINPKGNFNSDSATPGAPYRNSLYIKEFRLFWCLQVWK